MRTVIYFIVLILFASFNKTLIRQKTLPELIIQSDNILIGQIKSVTDSTLTFQTVETIKGGFVPSLLVSKRQKGEYNTRKLYTNITGQFELIFLTYDNDSKRHEFYTGHGEAEYLIKDSSVYIYNRSWYLTKNSERYPSQFISFDDNSIDATSFRTTEMCIAIKDFIKDAKSLAKKLYKEPDIKYIMEYKSPQKDDVTFTNKDIIDFVNKSKSHKRLIDELIDDPNNNLIIGTKNYH